MKYNSAVFKAYDIRGIYGRDFDDEFAYQLGLAYTKLRQEELGREKLTIVVGCDMRLSSPALMKELVKGLLAGGADVVTIGLAPTPTFYFTVAHYGYDGGIQVSASHNPKEYNGFKLVRQLASPLGLTSGLEDIKKLIDEGPLLPSTIKGTSRSQTDSLIDQVQFDLGFAEVKDIKPFHIIVDTANSMGALYFDELLKYIPQLKIEKINWELDGTFPAHEADPFKPENVKALCAAVREKKADLGVATDGDGDRIFFIDNEGQPIEPGIMRAIMAALFLRAKPKTTIAYDIRPGRITYDTIMAQGGQPLVTHVGHSLIKEAMIDTGAYFGGESSGHFFLNMDKEGCYEVPGIVFLKLLVDVSKSGKSLVEYIQPYKKYFHSGEINIPINDGQDKIIALKEKYNSGKQNMFDGLTVEYSDFWFNVRLSNTEPLLRLNLEAKTKEIMELKTKEILNFLIK